MSQQWRRFEKAVRRESFKFAWARAVLRVHGITKFRRRHGRFGRFVSAMRRKEYLRERKILYGVSGGSKPVGVLHAGTEGR